MDGKQIRDYVFDFEKLDVYQLALCFSDRVIKVVEKLPSYLKYTIGGNFIRAAMSVAHNIAEGSGKLSHADKARYYGYSLASVRECIPPITILFMEKCLSEETRNILRADCVKLGNMIVGLIKKTRS